MKHGKLYKILAFAVIAVLLLYFSFRGVDWRVFFQELKNTNWLWVVLAMAVGVLSYVFRSLRWCILLRSAGAEASFRSAFSGVNIGNLTNFAIPRAGELARCGSITASSGAEFERVFGTVVVERAIDLLSVFILAIVTVFVNIDTFGTFIKEHILSSLGEKAMGLGLIFCYFAVFCMVLVAIFLLLRPRLRDKAFYKKAIDFFKGLWSSIKMSLHLQQRWQFLGYTILIWGMYVLSSYFTILAFSATAHSLTMADALFLMIVGSFGWIVPVQGGFGAYHFLVSLALGAVYCIPHSDAMVFATISHESQAIAMLISALLSALLSAVAKNRQRESVSKD